VVRPGPKARDDVHVLYVGAVLPKRSETFVYREVLGLRNRGLRVSVASVREPERALDDSALEELANEAVVLYTPKTMAMALFGALRWPRVAVRGLLDAAFDPDLKPAQRPRVLVQTAAGLALAWRSKRLGITHVHAHMAHVPTTIAMYSAAALDVPMTFTGHAADLFRDRQMLATKLRRSSAVMCISRWHRHFYRSLIPLTDSQTPIVRCGVDVAEFSPGTGGAGILAVGRLVPKKGFDTLLRAFAMLASRIPDLRLVLIGDGPERDTLEALSRELGVESRVHMAGAGSQEDVREAMRRADCFALPCRVGDDGDRDGIPVVLMEAMASGVPVVCGDLATIRELVVDDDCGRLVEPDQPEAVADEIERLMTDDSLRRAVGEAGRKRIIEEFSLDSTLDQLLRVFVGAATESSRGAEAVSPRPVGGAAAKDS
jgi:glycosyltransferase involved in cell wall biosynthesis